MATRSLASRTLPTSFALAAGLLSLYLGARTLLARPDYGRPPRLAAVIDGGKMGEFLQSAAEKEAILRWVEAGAPWSGWAKVRVIFEPRCVRCHFTEPERFEVLPLDRYPPAAGAAEVRPVLEEKITGGTMGKYLESRDEQRVLLEWMAAGAPETGWREVAAILEDHCVQCHNPEGVAGLPSLDLRGPVTRLARLPKAERPSPPIEASAVLLLVSTMAILGIWRRGKKDFDRGVGPK